MSRLKPPCSADCPRRSIVPNCHNPDICPDWARYMEEKEAEREAEDKAKGAESDLSMERRCFYEYTRKRGMRR